MPVKFTQIAAATPREEWPDDPYLYALAEDGSVWAYNLDGWWELRECLTEQEEADEWKAGIGADLHQETVQAITKLPVAVVAYAAQEGLL